MEGVYFHFPFCRQACNYCNFHFSTQLKHQDKILQAFEKEIGLRSKEWNSAIELFEQSILLEKMFEGRHTNPSSVFIKRCKYFKEANTSRFY